MTSKLVLFALLFSVAVNIAVVGTLVYFWQHNGDQTRKVELFHDDAPPHDVMFWFNDPHVSPQIAKEIDSLRRTYHERLIVLRSDIDSTRRAIITHLMQEAVNRDSLEIFVRNLADKQINAERLTIDHLLEIKPLLPYDDWRIFIRDLEPRHTIRTKIIKMDSDDSTSILVNEEINEIQVFENRIINQDETIKIKPKSNQRRKP